MGFAPDRDPEGTRSASEVRAQCVQWVNGLEWPDGPERVFTRRTFATPEDEAAALAEYDALVAADCHPVKAFRLCLSDEVT